MTLSTSIDSNIWHQMTAGPEVKNASTQERSNTDTLKDARQKIVMGIWGSRRNIKFECGLPLPVHDLVCDHGYLPLVVSTSWSFPHSRLITGFITRLTRRVPLVEQALLNLPEHLSSPTVFSGVRVTRSLVLYVCFVDCCLSFCTFSFGHCVVCSSSIYGFWLPLWYLQTLLIKFEMIWFRTRFKSWTRIAQISICLTHHAEILTRTLNNFVFTNFYVQTYAQWCQKTHLTLWVSWAKNSKRSIGKLDSVVSFRSGKHIIERLFCRRPSNKHSHQAWFKFAK